MLPAQQVELPPQMPAQSTTAVPPQTPAQSRTVPPLQGHCEPVSLCQQFWGWAVHPLPGSPQAHVKST